MHRAWFAWIAVFAWAAVAQAAVVIPKTPEELTREAGVVVRGTVLSQAEAFDAAAKVPVVETRVRVDEAWKGSPAREITLRQLGRLRGGRVLGVPGDAQLAVGDDVVLFLAVGYDGEVGYHFLLGLAQGAWRVPAKSPGAPLEQSIAGLHFTRAGRRTAPPTLEQLRAKVAGSLP